MAGFLLPGWAKNEPCRLNRATSILRGLACLRCSSPGTRPGFACGYDGAGGRLLTICLLFLRLPLGTYAKCLIYGVDDGARTHDNRNHNPGLYQLSYIHHCVASNAGNENSGLPDRNRTCNPQLRRLVLYPVELRAETHFSGNKWGGRGEGIRTPDILLPKQARYRAALHPEILFMHTSCISEKRDYTWAEWVWSIFA